MHIKLIIKGIKIFGTCNTFLCKEIDLYDIRVIALLVRWCVSLESSFRSYWLIVILDRGTYTRCVETCVETKRTRMRVCAAVRPQARSPHSCLLLYNF